MACASTTPSLPEVVNFSLTGDTADIDVRGKPAAVIGASQQILLQLHLVNTTSAPVSGSASLLFR